MPKLKITCTVDGTVVGDYEFDVTQYSGPQKLVGGPIAIYFDPVGDTHHVMSIDALPPFQSATIAGSDVKTTST